MRAKTIAFLFVVSVLFLSVPAVEASYREEFGFAEKRDLDIGIHRGHAVLSVEKQEIVAGERFSVDIRFVNDSGGWFFYNPFFSRLLPVPGELVLYDSDHKYVKGFLDFKGGSRRGVKSSDWVLIPSGSYVGTRACSARIEKAGTYYLQMVYYKVFISPRPDRLQGNPPKTESERIQEFYKDFSREELFRSNVVKITVVEKTGEE